LQVERDFLAGQPAISRLLRGRPMIAPNAGLSVNRQYRLLRIARSSFYYQPQPTSAEELDLLNRLDRIFAASGNSKFRFRG
jgi:hypothetical protein